jgi:hypothetical protein
MTEETSAPSKPLWNSLETAKIVVGVLTPLAIFFFTYQSTKTQTQQTQAKAAVVRQEAQERERQVQIAKKRVEL